MNNNQDSIITQYLTSLIENLERKLDYPKNTWKRREHIQSEIDDARKRLNSVSRRNPRSGSFGDGRRPPTGHRTSFKQQDQGRPNLQRSDAPQKTSQPQLLEVSYR